MKLNYGSGVCDFYKQKVEDCDTTPVVGYQYSQFTYKIECFLQENKIQTRPGAGLGMWCLYLLPLSILSSSVMYPPVSEVYEMACAASICLFGASHLLIWIMIMSKQYHRKGFFVINMLTVALSVTYMHCNFVVVIFLNYAINTYYPKAVIHAMKYCSKSFTFGECCVVIQALFVFLIASVRDLIEMWRTDVESWTETQHVNVIIELGLLGIMFVSFLPLLFPVLQSPLPFSILFVSTMAGGVIPIMWIYFQQFPLIWFYEMVFNNNNRPVLIVYWVICTLISIAIVNAQLSSSQHASTAVRKYFHFLMVAICVPGVTLDPVILYLASGVFFAVFCFMEAVRLLKYPVIGLQLQKAFSIFIDEKDVGPLVLTHIYLLSGCCLPLWFHPNIMYRGARRSLLSGMLAVGVGDAAASIGGTYFGKRKWPGSQKTLEGTVASVVCQGLAVAFMVYFQLVSPSMWSIIRALSAAVLTALVESLTDQVDNLVLPMLAYLILL